MQNLQSPVEEKNAQLLAQMSPIQSQKTKKLALAWWGNPSFLQMNCFQLLISPKRQLHNPAKMRKTELGQKDPIFLPRGDPTETMKMVNQDP
ncbi:hypothetical protein ACLOJK_020760 [Asimina triloba]